LLPPEIRSRIYDYVFSDCVVRVRIGSLGHKGTYEILICQTSDACELQWRQRHGQQIVPLPTGLDSPEVFGKGAKLDDCRTHQRCQIPVHLLQVCRQTYHEAALKPFTQATFDFIIYSWRDHGAGPFLAALIPVQARAITHARFTCFSGFHMNKNSVPRSTGLKHVEVFVENINGRYTEGQQLIILKRFERQGGVRWLKGIGLKSMHFTVGLNLHASTDDGRAAVLEWIRQQESEILSKQQPLLAAD
jgi:hypothetical protein